MKKTSFEFCVLVSCLVLLSLTLELPTAVYANSKTSEPDAADLMVRKKEAMQHFQLAKSFHVRELYEAAIREYQKALELNPDWEEAKADLAWARKDLELKQRLSESQRTSLPDVVRSAQEYYERGCRLEAANDLVEAAQAYKKALQILNDYPEAKAALARVQNQARDSLVVDAHTFRKRRMAEEMNGWQSERKTSSKELKDVYSRAAPPAPGPSTHVAPAPASNPGGRISQAIQTHFLAGSQALDQGDWNTAIREFELVLEFMPNHKKAAYKLEIAKDRRAGQMKAAEQRAAAAEDPIEKVKAVRDLSSMDPENAKNRQAWEKMKKENPQLGEELYHKGVAAYATGKYQEALQNWQLVLDLNPGHKKALDSIKKVREKILLISDQK